MEFLSQDFVNKLILRSRDGLDQAFDFWHYKFNNFQLVNSFLIDKILSTDKTNLLITIPGKDRFKEFLLLSTLIPTLHGIRVNQRLNIEFQVNEIILHKKDGRVSTVKAINGDQIQILPLGTTKRIELGSPENYIQLSSKYANKLEEAKHSKERVKNFERKMYEFYNQYRKILSHFLPCEMYKHLPFKNMKKTIIVASKTELLCRIPTCIPLQYMNRNGEVYPDTPFDPLLIVVSDFNTVKVDITEHDRPRILLFLPPENIPDNQENKF